MAWLLGSALTALLPFRNGVVFPSLRRTGIVVPSEASSNGSHASLITAERYTHGECGVHTSSPDALNYCGVCRMGDTGRPNLFVKESEEGTGSRLHSIIYAMAVAAANNMNFGGVISYIICSHRHYDRDHGENILPVLGAVLGLDNPEGLFTESPPPFDETYVGLKAFEAESQSERGNRGGNILLLGNFGGHLNVDIDNVHGHNLSGYIGSRFLEQLRRPTTPLFARLLEFEPGRPSVALHVRRGDIFLEDKARVRTTPDEWYYWLMGEVQRYLPNADIHMWTALKGRSSRRNLKPAHNVSEFDGYRQRQATVHLDGDIVDAWAHFARADVVVLAKSSFSTVPALLNGKCVIYQRWWLRPLDEWIEASDAWRPRDEWTIDTEKLKACLWRVKPWEKAAEAAFPAPAPAAVSSLDLDPPLHEVFDLLATGSGEISSRAISDSEREARERPARNGQLRHRRLVT